MQHSQISPIEKIISITSYFTTGIVGLVWVIIAYILKKKIRFFLMYNIVQSMVIGIFLAIFSLIFNILFSIFAIIPFLGTLAAKINYYLSIKIISIFSLSFNIIELFLTIFLVYISIGVIMNRIFYIPILTGIIKSVMKKYN